MIFLAGVVFESAVASPADWPMYRNNLQHTGVAADTLPPPLALKWKQTFGGAVVSSPAIVGSRIYVGVNDASFNFYALDATTGNIIWSFNDGGTGGTPTTSWWSSPAVTTVGGNTVIFVGNANGLLYAIRDDGTAPFKLWSLSLGGGPVLSSPAVTTIGATQVVIAAGSAAGPIGQLWAVVAATGAKYPGWTTNPFTEAGALAFTSSPAILGSTIFIGNDNDKLYAVNLGNGVKLWDTASILPAITGPVISSPAVASVSGCQNCGQDYVFFGADNNKMYALVAATGALKWSEPVGNKIRSSPAIATIPNPPAACAPGPTLVVIFGSDDGNTYAMRATDGTPCWAFPSTGAAFFRSSPIVSGGTVYIGSNDHNIYAIDLNTGSWQWSFPATGDVGDLAGYGCPNPVVGVDPALYFGSNTGDDSLYAFKAAIPVVTTTSTNIVSTSTTTTVPVTQTSTLATSTTTTGITQTQTSMTATTQTQTATSTSITTTQTQTATISSTTSTTTTVPSQGIPGFPVESILVGLAGGLVLVTLLGRRRRRQ